MSTKHHIGQALLVGGGACIAAGVARSFAQRYINTNHIVGAVGDLGMEAVGHGNQGFEWEWR